MTSVLPPLTEMLASFVAETPTSMWREAATEAAATCILGLEETGNIVELMAAVSK